MKAEYSAVQSPRSAPWYVEGMCQGICKLPFVCLTTSWLITNPLCVQKGGGVARLASPGWETLPLTCSVGLAYFCEGNTNLQKIPNVFQIVTYSEWQ